MIKFTDSGEIVSAYKAIYFKRRPGIEIFTRDTGRGMSEEFEQRMLEELARQHLGRKSNTQLTEPSICTVKRIVEKLKGEVQFDSTRNKSSEFYIFLSLRQ